MGPFQAQVPHIKDNLLNFLNQNAFELSSSAILDLDLGLLNRVMRWVLVCDNGGYKGCLCNLKSQAVHSTAGHIERLPCLSP